MALDVFTPHVAEWFTRAFAAPTAVQQQAWPLIAQGEHVLISAPTGSGKTLAAFLYGLDRLAAHPLPTAEKRVRLLYVSPLKALSHDVDRNLRAPLAGITAAAASEQASLFGDIETGDAAGNGSRGDAPEITVALRTGDTPQRDRAAMRRRPPDVLITTPESLFLMLTSGAREMLTGVETVIVDEIHAVAGTKRGSHLALTLERLSALREDDPALRPGAWTGDEMQRIGLSATQNPLEEIGRFLVGPQRRCRIVETGEKKKMDLKIQVPVESMTELDLIGARGAGPAAGAAGAGGVGLVDAAGDPFDPDGADAPGGGSGKVVLDDPDGVLDDSDGVLGDGRHGGAASVEQPDPIAVELGDPLEPQPVRGGEATRNSIWPAMYPEILDLVEQHRSTIVFVNSRRSAERLALRLNELAEQRMELARREAGLGDPAEDPDVRWDEDPDVARQRRDNELRRLIADADAPIPADAADVPSKDGAPFRDADVTLSGPDRHAQILPPPPPRPPEGDADSANGAAGSQTPRPGIPPTPPPTGPHAIEIARAHHGSLSREEREVVEELLKQGKLPCLVATSSLELGIDMGAVDLVLQIESPKSVAAGLQRIGRAGHGVGETAKGRIFPKFRADLLECTVVVRRMREGLIEPTVVPRNPLDVLAQQIVAIAASAGPPPGSAEAKQQGEDDEPVITVDEVYALVTRTYPYAELPRELFERTLDMLDGRYPSQEFADLRPRVVWDRVGGTIRPRKGAGRLAIANAGTIPDRGLYRVVLPDGRRVGELDEEMVYEARAGQTFLLGASTWRIEEIGRDKVVVTPAPGAPGAVPFWRGDQRGRPKSLGEAIGAFSRWAVDQDEETLVRDYDLDPLAARNLLDFLLEQQEATGVIPSDRTLVIERFKDEIGDWRVCVLSPYGGRVHAAWGLAVSRRIRDEIGIEADAIWSDDGIIIHLPEGASPSGGFDEDLEQAVDLDADWERIRELLVPDPDETEELIVSELGTSALFGARFRENAGRALLIPRARPGQRTPLWQQRLKAQTLLEVAQRFPDFPIILETYRECLRDVLDVPGLVVLLRQLQQREVTIVEVETPTASPMAGSLLFDYVATYMYEGDAPNAERRAAALSLDRDLLRELLGQDELRDLLDAGALAQLEADLQHRSPRTRATNPDALAEVLRRVGDLTLDELAERVALDGERPDEDGVVTAPAAIDGGAPDFAARRERAAEWLDRLDRERRAVRMRIGSEERWIAADDAGLYRDALGAVPPGGLPEAFLGRVGGPGSDDPLRRLVQRYAATHGPFVDRWVRERYGVDVSSVLRELLRKDELVRGEMRPDGTETEHCDPEILRRLRRMSLAVLRQEIEPVDARALVPFVQTWQGVDRYRPAGAGPDRLREVLVPLQGVPLPVELWENDVLPRRLGAYSPAWLDGLCASGELVWVGAGSSGGVRSGRGRVALYFRDDAAAIGPPMGRTVAGPGSSAGGSARPPAPGAASGDAHGPSSPAHDAVRQALAQRPMFFGDIVATLPEPAPALRDALWDLIWAGEVTCDVFAPLRAGRAGMKPGGSAAAGRAASPSRSRLGGRRRFGPRGTTAAPSATQGRFSLTAPLFADVATDGTPVAVDPGLRRRTLAELLLERHGIVTREHVRAEGIAGGFSTLYDSFGALETLGVCRRGYFVEGLGAAQFALPGAVERLRAQSLPAGTGHEVSAVDAFGQPLPATTLDATDPAQPYGTLLPWPSPPDPEVDQARADAHGSGALRRPATANPPRPQRAQGARVVLVGPDPIVFCDRSGKAFQVLVSYDDPRLPAALKALVDAVASGQAGSLPRKGIQLERIDGLDVIGHPLERLLVAAGFRAAPTKYIARA